MSDLHHRTYIAGTKYRPGAEAHLLTLPTDAELLLIREPTNEHDRNAVKIMDRDMLLGYVPRDLAAEVGTLILEQRLIKCVRSGKPGAGIHIHYSKPEDQITHG